MRRPWILSISGLVWVFTLILGGFQWSVWLIWGPGNGNHLYFLTLLGNACQVWILIECLGSVRRLDALQFQANAVATAAAAAKKTGEAARSPVE